MLSHLADRLSAAADRADDLALLTEGASNRLRPGWPRLAQGALRLTHALDAGERRLRSGARQLRQLEDLFALLRVDIKSEQAQTTLEDPRDFP